MPESKSRMHSCLAASLIFDPTAGTVATGLLPEWQALLELLQREPSWQPEARALASQILQAHTAVADRYTSCGAQRPLQPPMQACSLKLTRRLLKIEPEARSSCVHDVLQPSQA